MLVDAYLHLYEVGKITNSCPVNRGKMMFTFCLGSSQLYEWVNLNPMMEIAPVDYVNNIERIAAHDKMISINSCSRSISLDRSIRNPSGCGISPAQEGRLIMSWARSNRRAARASCARRQ